MNPTAPAAGAAEKAVPKTKIGTLIRAAFIGKYGGKNKIEVLKKKSKFCPFPKTETDGRGSGIEPHPPRTEQKCQATNASMPGPSKRAGGRGSDGAMEDSFFDCVVEKKNGNNHGPSK